MSLYLMGAYKKAGQGLLVRAENDKTRGNSFTLRFRLDIRKKRILYCEGAEALKTHFLKKLWLFHPW